MLIKNAVLIDPVGDQIYEADLRIRDGKINEIGTGLLTEASEETIDVSGKCVAPGLIDGHVHFRDPGFTYKEDLHTGALSAAAGGFTSVICMANTKPVADCA